MNLPSPSLQAHCIRLLDQRLEASPDLVNFALDALLSSVIGTSSRDFQLELCDTSELVFDDVLMEDYGPEYLMPDPPRLNVSELARVDGIMRSFQRGSGATYLPHAFVMMDDAYRRASSVEKAVGRRLARLRKVLAIRPKPGGFLPIAPAKKFKADKAEATEDSDPDPTKAGFGPAPSVDLIDFKPVSAADCRRLVEFWKSLSDVDQAAHVCITRQQLLDVSCLFPMWLTFRLHVRVHRVHDTADGLFNPMLRPGPHGAGCTCKHTTPFCIGPYLSAFPDVSPADVRGVWCLPHCLCLRLRLPSVFSTSCVLRGCACCPRTRASPSPTRNHHQRSIPSH